MKVAGRAFFLLQNSAFEVEGPKGALEKLSGYFSFLQQKKSFPEKPFFSLKLENFPFPENFDGKKFKYKGQGYERFDYLEKVFVAFYDGSVAVSEKNREKCVLYSQNQKKLFLWATKILKTICFDFLQEKGFHGVHALSFCLGKKCAVVFLRSGHGKSSIAAELVSKNSGAELLSDELTFISETGIVAGFPVPIQLYSAKRNVAGLKKNELHVEKKFCINPVKKKEQGMPIAKPSAYFIGWRPNLPEPKIRQISGSKLSAFLRKRFFEGGEFELLNPFLKERKIIHSIKKIPKAISKKNALSADFSINFSKLKAASVAGRTKAFELELSKDASKNAKFLAEFLEKLK